jgi:hypothetical protein
MVWELFHGRGKELLFFFRTSRQALGPRILEVKQLGQV